LCEAWTIDDLATTDLVAAWTDVAVHPDRVLEDWPVLILDACDAKHWTDGKTIVAGAEASGLCRVYASDGAWLGVGRAADGHSWRPHKVVLDGA
jgi:hypothetical protein